MTQQKMQARRSAVASSGGKAGKPPRNRAATQTTLAEPVEGRKKVGGYARDPLADKARKASDAVLGDIVGMAKPISIPDLPEDEVELSVGEDRKRLLLQGLALLALVLALLALTFWSGVFANASGNVWLLLAMVALLTTAWFVSKRMGRLLGKYFSKTGVIDFGHTYVYIYEKSVPKEATVITYRDVKSYRIVRQGNSLRLLLWGGWVKHPSGYLYVGITRPFMADTLEDLEIDIRTTMARHHVKENQH
ncbi:MAG: hypothetical protein MR874_11740 [Coriobacteriaceae bacterium]|nr:hypothetical protein [Coriobacteriaceae bacterium]MCI6548602.1 hypothetical protein [Coriobacteriaceae bacterium]MCI6845407.1 hypothetical protein [Coriobacteriaceae bacterium]MCI7438731.1 hypothetical protein [Coriobacteriaceae bacterium]MDD7583312.1 hypothetical protein [Coriobacteriaceae bacterium]